LLEDASKRGLVKLGPKNASGDYPVRAAE
jgi:hypothetical protein